MKNIAIIGAGIMGIGLAQRYLMSGYNVQLLDISQDSLEKARIEITNNLTNASNKGLIDPKKLNIYKNNLILIDSIYKISQKTEMVIEAATENFENKVKIFESLNNIINTACIIATNTSCLSINKLSSFIKNKQNFIGTHYFYPAERNRLIEIIPSKNTSADTIDKIKTIADNIDKISIVCIDSPGFCINRFFVPLMNEVSRLIDNTSYTPYQINYSARRAFKSSLGPIDIMNMTGTTLAYRANKELYERLGDSYKPSKLLESMAKTNQLWDIEENSFEKDEKYANLSSSKEIILHLQSYVKLLVLKIIEEGISDPSDINLAAKIGLGWKIGPLDLFESQIDLKTTRLIIKDNNAIIQLLRVDKLNAINSKLLQDIENNIDYCLKDPKIDRIFIKGYPKVFSAGADIKFFLENLSKSNYNNIYDFTKYAHKIILKIQTSPKPFIALIDGIAYGGGLELALCCHKIIATKRSQFQFPENLLGLIPGFGGTQNTPKRTGIKLAKYLILFSKSINATEALKYNLIDNLVDLPSGFEEHSMIISANETQCISDLDLEITKKIALLEKCISKNTLKKLNFNESSFKAITITNKLLEESLTLSLEQGLSLELHYLQDILSQNTLKQQIESIFKT